MNPVVRALPDGFVANRSGLCHVPGFGNCYVLIVVDET